MAAELFTGTCSRERKREREREREREKREKRERERKKTSVHFIFLKRFDMQGNNKIKMERRKLYQKNQSRYFPAKTRPQVERERERDREREPYLFEVSCFMFG